MVLRRRHTRHTDDDLAGETIQRSIRLPKVQIDAVQEHIERGVPDIHTLTDAVSDALWLWDYEMSRTTTGPRVARSVPLVAAEPDPEPEPEPGEDDTEAEQAAPERAFAGVGLRLPGDAADGRPDFSSVELPPAGA